MGEKAIKWGEGVTYFFGRGTNEEEDKELNLVFLLVENLPSEIGSSFSSRVMGKKNKTLSEVTGCTTKRK